LVSPVFFFFSPVDIARWGEEALRKKKKDT
jgi:hypothetical protein